MVGNSSAKLNICGNWSRLMIYGGVRNRYRMILATACCAERQATSMTSIGKKPGKLWHLLRSGAVVFAMIRFC